VSRGVSAAVFDPKADMSKPGLLWRVLSAAFGERIRVLLEEELSKVLKQTLDQLVKNAA